MKINVIEILKSYDGQPASEVDSGTRQRQPLTIRSAISSALNGIVVRNEVAIPLTAEEKARIYQLCTKLFSTKEPDFTVDDMAFIKKRAGEVGNISPLIAGRLADLFERRNSKVDNKKIKS